MTAQSETEMTEIAQEMTDLLSRCPSDATVAESEPGRVRLTDIPESGGAHMLPGGFSMLELLGDHWDDWDIEYVENDETIMMGSRSGKDVVITREA